MSTVTQTRKESKPVHGRCRWTHRYHDGSAHVGMLEINGTPYAVSLIPGGIELRKGDGTVYHVGTANSFGWSCDCPDAEFRSRPGGCKHVAALRKALVAIGVEPLPAAPTIPAACPLQAEDL